MVITPAQRQTAPRRRRCRYGALIGSSLEPVRARVAAAILFVGLLPGVVALADAGNDLALPLWLATALCLGWITRSPWSVLLPFLAIPIAVPFGYPEDYPGHDPLPLWFGVLMGAPLQALVVALGVGGRYMYERTRMFRRFRKGPERY